MSGSAMRSGDGGAIATAGRGDDAAGRVDVGLLIAVRDGGEYRPFVARLATDAADALADETAVAWRFHAERVEPLPADGGRRAAEFLDRATDRMIEGSYDVVAVVTDAPLRSSRERFVPGLASELARVAVISTRNLRRAPRGEARRPLDAEAVRWNAATLLVHLLGHVFGADHRSNGVMAPFRFEPDRRAVPAFGAAVEDQVERIASETPEPDVTARGPAGRLAFYAASAVRNPGLVARALRRSRAPLLALSLPTLSTAALAPTLIIVFSAEAWDVGFHMSDLTAALFATASVLLAALYVLFSQRLFFPRRRRRVVTEHTALVNVTTFLVLLFAMWGLFVLVGSVILTIELVVFPPDLMSNWPSLQDPAVGLRDLVRTAGFISTVGVLSGALAGGLENRTIVRHLTLFRDEP